MINNLQFLDTTPTVTFHDIAEYHYAPGWKHPYVLGGLAAALLVISVAGIIIWRIYHRPVVITAWDQAFKDLDLLDPQNCSSQQDFSRFYVDLTRVLKWYVEKRFGLSVKHKTDDEVVVFLRQQATSRRNYAELDAALEQLASELDSLFEGAKYIKFANTQALRDRAQKDRETVREFVKRTIPAQS